MRPVLVDSSVWIAHFKNSNVDLIDLLQNDLVLMHPFVLGELACGTPPKRRQMLKLLGKLESTHVATVDDVLKLIEHHSLYGLGCGFVDMALLASVIISPGATLWTLDKRLSVLAVKLGVAHEVATPMH